MSVTLFYRTNSMEIPENSTSAVRQQSAGGREQQLDPGKVKQKYRADFMWCRSTVLHSSQQVGTGIQYVVSTVLLYYVAGREECAWYVGSACVTVWPVQSGSRRRGLSLAYWRTGRPMTDTGTTYLYCTWHFFGHPQQKGVTLGALEATRTPSYIRYMTGISCIGRSV